MNPSDERILVLREMVRRAFPADPYFGNVTNYDKDLQQELTEKNEALDEDQDLYRMLRGRGWTEIPKYFLYSHPDGYVLLSEDAFSAFLPAWLLRALDNVEAEDEVRNFLVYAFSNTAQQLRHLNQEQRRTVRALLAEFAGRGTEAPVRKLIPQAIEYLDRLG